MKQYAIVAISNSYVHRMTIHYPDKRLAESAARRLAATNRGIVFRVEEVRA